MSLLTGLVAYYKFDEGTSTVVGDATANANNGTAHGTFTWPTGKINTAGGFDGASAYVSVPDATSLVITGTLSIAAWINPSALSNAVNQVLIKNKTNSAYYGIYVTSAGRLFFQCEGPAGGSFGSTGTIPTNTWTHVVVVYDGAHYLIYLNGALDSTSGSETGAIGDTTGAALAIGQDLVNSGRWWTGAIDEIPIYARALTSTEVSSLYNGGAGLPYPFAVGPTFSLSVASASSTTPTTITAIGSSTAWTSGTTFHAVSGTISGLSVNVAAQTATFLYTPPASFSVAALTDTISDSTDSATAALPVLWFTVPSSPSTFVPGTLDTSLLAVAASPAPTSPYSLVAGAGTGITFNNLHWLAYNDGILAAADKGSGTVAVFTSSTGALLHSWTVAFGGANIGGIAVDPSGNIYVVETAYAGNSNTGKVHQYSQAGVESTGAWPYALAFAVSAGWGWQATSTWYMVVPNPGGGAQLITTAGASGSTNSMTNDFGGAQAPGARLTTSTYYGSNPQYVRTWNADGTLAAYFGSGPRFAQTTGGHVFSILAGAVSMSDGTVYVADSDNSLFYRFSATGIQSGSTLVTGYTMTQYCPVASDGTTIWFGDSTSGGRIVAISRANLDTLCTYPRAYDYNDHSLGIGAGIISSAPINYYASGSTPVISIHLDAWWSQIASLTARYCIQTAAQLQAQTARVWSTISSLTTGGNTAIPSPPSSTGHYQVEVQLLQGGVPIGAEVLYYTVGPSGATLAPASLATTGTTRYVQIIDEVWGTLGVCRAQFDWSKALAGYSGGTTQVPDFSSFDSDYAAASAEAATRGEPFLVQIFGGNTTTDNAIATAGAVSHYVGSLVQHYGAAGLGYVHNWEIWNEPDNSFTGTTTSFATTVITPAVAAIHSADAAAKAVGPSYGSTNASALATIMANGGNGLDILSCHPYGQNNQAFEEHGEPALIDAFKAVSGVSGKPIWFTEYGGWMDSLQPNLLYNAYAHTHALLWAQVKGVARLYPYVPEGTGGLSNLQGVITYQDSNHPWYLTLAGAAALGAKTAFAGRTYSNQPSTGAPLVYAARWVDSTQQVAIWTDLVQVPMQVTSSAACTLTLRDAFGASSTQALSAGGVYTFAATALPSYIEAPTTTTLTLAPQESIGTNLALAATPSVSSSGTSSGGATALHDGIVDAQGSDGFPIGVEWYQAVTDTAPFAVLTLASASTVDRVLVVSHSAGGSMPSLRTFAISVQVGGVWQRAALVTNQYVQRAAWIPFTAVANVTAIRLDVLSVNYGGNAGGLQPYFWATATNANGHGGTAYNNGSQFFYGPAPVFELQAYAPGTAATPPFGIALGAYISDSTFYPGDDQPPSGVSGLDTWRTTFGATPVLLLDYINWPAPGDFGAYPNPNNAADNFTDFSQRAFLVPRARGTTLFIKWQPASATALSHSSYDATSWNPFKLSTITSGAYDIWITGFAKAAAVYGQPILLSFGHEMNGNWYSWGCAAGNSQGNTAADFVNAWRHCWGIFQSVGATNVKWPWCPNTGSGSFPILTDAYPGDAYVDWIGWDGYNSPALSFTQCSALFGADYTTLAGLGSGTKPILIAETGCRAATNGGVSSGDSATARADWLNRLCEMGYSGTGLSQWPRVQALIYYHQNQGTSGDWRLTGDANTQAAWTAITADSRYQGVLNSTATAVVSRPSRFSTRSFGTRTPGSGRTFKTNPDTQHANLIFPVP